MATDQDNLLQNVFNYFLALYHQGQATKTSGATLAFEPIGVPIAPVTFKLQPTDTAYSPALAIEHLSEITNVVPIIDGDAFGHGLHTIDGLYGQILLGAEPSSAEVTGQFAAVKAAAGRLFDPMLGSSVPNNPYRFHPAYATPVDWYDPTSANWTSQRFGDPTPPPAAGSAPSGPKPPAAAATPPRVMVRPLQWRVLPQNLRPVLNRPELLAQHLPPAAVATHPFAPHPVSPFFPAHNLAVAHVMPVAAPHVAPPVAPLHLASVHVAPPVAIHTTVAPSPMPHPVVLAPHPAFQAMRPMFAAAATVQLANVTSKEPANSDHFGITFDFSLVRIARPWLSLDFLAMKHWYLPGYQAGELTNQADPATANDRFAWLPTAFIVIKKLRITAAWSPQDLDKSLNAAALGPFSLIGRSFDQKSSTISCDGPQILAWICEPLPLLPPDAPPAPAAAAGAGAAQPSNTDAAPAATETTSAAIPAAAGAAAGAATPPASATTASAAAAPTAPPPAEPGAASASSPAAAPPPAGRPAQ